MKLQLIFVLYVFVFRFACALEIPFPPHGDAERQHECNSQLHSFDGRHWSAILTPSAGGGDAMPLFLIRLPDGVVAGFWNLNGGRISVVRHFRGDPGLDEAFPFTWVSPPGPQLQQQPQHLKDIAQDGSGVVWAIQTDLFVYNGREWSMPPSLFPSNEWDTTAKGQMPMSLTRMQDGSMACVWQLPGRRLAVTSHARTGSRLLGECEGGIENSGLKSAPFADSHNRLWITDAKPDIYRADGGGGVARIYSIKPEQLIDVNDLKAHFGVVSASEDGHGRVWIWSNSWAGGINGAALRGVLIFDGDNARQQEKFDGITGQRYSFVDRKDDRHMWVGVLKEGLFEVNIDTLKAKPVAEAVPGAFQWVKKVFSAGGDLFVIASRTGDIFHNALWRQRGGTWTRLIDNVDNRPIPDFDSRRPWLRSGDDIILCCYDAAPWLIRKNGPAVRLDWQFGFSIENARKLFRLTDGSIFALSSSGHPFHGTISPGQQAQSKPRATELIIAYHGWATDAGGNVWAVLSGSPNVLSEWNGVSWIPHPFPPEFGQMHFLGAAADTRGRIWLMPNSAEKITAFFDPHSGKWQTFPKIEAAFESVKNDPPDFVGVRPEFYAPDYSADRTRIAFRSASWEIAYYDGAKWRRWKRSDIEPNSSRNYFTMGPPFFDSAGLLCFNIGNDTWQFDGKDHWAKVAVSVKFPDERTGGGVRFHQRVAPPQGCVTDTPDSIALDNQGVCWLTWQGRLYKCASGACVPIFSEGEPNPFTTGRKITDAWVDSHGCAFLQPPSIRE